MEKFEKIRAFFKEYDAKEALLIDLKEAETEVKPESVKVVIKAQIKVAEADLKELKEKFKLEFDSPEGVDDGEYYRIKAAKEEKESSFNADNSVKKEDVVEAFKNLAKEAMIITKAPESSIKEIKEPEIAQKEPKRSIYRIKGGK